MLPELVMNMQKRICPGCGRVWYSADSGSPWVCEICGAIMPVPEEENGGKEGAHENSSP
jgi:ribosomal protein L37AE/L43A